MAEEQANTEVSTAGTSAESAWEDPTIPAGDSPPLPSWPLYGAIVLWVAWIGFLLAMVGMRLMGTSA